MNYIEFFEKQIEKYNKESKCDFCWFFSAPLTRSAMNVQQLREDSKCCVQVMYVQDEGSAFSTQNNYNFQTTFRQEAYCQENFILYFLIPDNLGKNNYNEIDGYSIEESRSEVLMRLKDCISCDVNLDFCEFLNQEMFITRWDGYQHILKEDNNYIGYKVYVSLRDKMQ